MGIGFSNVSLASMRKSLIAVLVTYAVGVVVQIISVLLIGIPRPAPAFIAVTGGALAYLVWVLPIPFIVSLYQRWRTGTFPHGTFAKLTYTILSVLAVSVLIGDYHISDKL